MSATPLQQPRRNNGNAKQKEQEPWLRKFELSGRTLPLLSFPTHSFPSLFVVLPLRVFVPLRLLHTICELAQRWHVQLQGAPFPFQSKKTGTSHCHARLSNFKVTYLFVFPFLLYFLKHSNRLSGGCHVILQHFQVFFRVHTRLKAKNKKKKCTSIF